MIYHKEKLADGLLNGSYPQIHPTKSIVIVGSHLSMFLAITYHVIVFLELLL